MLTEVKLVDGVQYLYDGCFMGTGLTSIYFPQTVSTYDDNVVGYAIDGTKLEDFTIYGYPGSSAQEYAESHNFTFVSGGPCYNGHVWDIQEEESPATCTQNGYGSFLCRYCDEEKDDVIPALGHDYTEGVCSRCGRKDPDVFLTGLTDVSTDSYYYDALNWAVNHEPQITAGTSNNTFSPNQRCTRAQIVTFLWRANGSPEPGLAASPFTDVRQTAYYYDAVRWAVENGITSGVSQTSFCPSKTCTRSEAVTFLWRASGSPIPTQTEIPFSDVPGDTWYTTPVLWAVENNVTVGTSETTFSPNQICNRAQIVTFLWRTSQIPE